MEEHNYFKMSENEKKHLRVNLILTLYTMPDIQMFDGKKEKQKVIRWYLTQLKNQGFNLEDYAFINYISDTINSDEYNLSKYGL